MYEYEAIVTSVYDGDTITIDIDLGFDVILKKQKIRLLGINTPEVRGSEREKGLVSRDALREKILGEQVIIKTEKRGKYGRWLGTIYIERTNVNQWLINEGYAEEYKK